MQSQLFDLSVPIDHLFVGDTQLTLASSPHEVVSTFVSIDPRERELSFDFPTLF